MTDEGMPDFPASCAVANGSFFRRFLGLAGGYWTSREKWRARGLTAGLLGLTVAQVLIPVAINRWSAELFDALEQHSLDRFMVVLAALGVIVAAAIAINAGHLLVKRHLQLGWRQWLTQRLLGEWMSKGRHHQAALLGGANDNPDQRIAEDIRISTEAAIDLAHSMIYSALLLISFIQILWSLSGPPMVQLGSVEFFLPGHLVWAAFLYATFGTVAAVRLGRPLVDAANARQKREADFRFGLVHARENSEAIAVLRGEKDERRRLLDLFRDVREAWNRQSTALTHYFIFTSGYSVLSTAFPVLVAAPRYIGGAISLGGLMQTAQAFQQMAAALSWPVDNLPRLAEWRASVERVLGLHDMLCRVESQACAGAHSAIVREVSDQPVLRLSDLTISKPNGEPILRDLDAEVHQGERVLISGDSGAAVRLFKVIAGLWPWGHGRVDLPCGASIFFLTQRPYLPLGTLRQVLTYPAPPDSFSSESMIHALARIGLGDLISHLDQTAKWEDALTSAEQQLLGFVRLLIHRPDWIFLQQATDALDPRGEEEMMALVTEEFPQATIITVGYHPRLWAFHERRMTLVRADRQGLVMVRERRRAPRDEDMPPPRRPGLSALG